MQKKIFFSQNVSRSENIALVYCVKHFNNSVFLEKLSKAFSKTNKQTTIKQKNTLLDFLE